MKMAWLLGWATPETWFAPIAHGAFPGATHFFIAPGPEAATALAAAGPIDWLIGYSLGAQFLLARGPRGLQAERVALLAPFFSFASEDNLGGRCSRMQLRYLARWIRRDPRAALADFYRRAGLDIPESLGLGTALEDWLWGLDFLERTRVEPGLPDSWIGVCGAEDTLLNATRLQALEPRITIMPKAGHHPLALLTSVGAACTR